MAREDRIAIDLADVRRVGSGLNRPECVVANAAGDIFTADWRGGVAHVRADGTQALYRGEFPGGRPVRPNGIALRRDGTFLFADLGDEQGGVFALSRDGEIRPFLEAWTALRCRRRTSCSRTPGAASGSRSARGSCRARAATGADVADGFIVLVDAQAARASSPTASATPTRPCSTPDGAWLYVNETFARRLSRFPRRAATARSDRARCSPTFGHGTYPDGLAFDAEGHRVDHPASSATACCASRPTAPSTLDPRGCRSRARGVVEAAYLAGTLGRPHLDRAAGRVLQQHLEPRLRRPRPAHRLPRLPAGRRDLCLRFRRSPASPPVHWTLAGNAGMAAPQRRARGPPSRDAASVRSSTRPTGRCARRILDNV